MLHRCLTHFATLALLASTCVPGSARAATNLLSNPGAETGTLAGWIQGGVSNPSIDDGSFDGFTPASGLYDFYGGNGTDGTLTQNVPLTGIPNAQIATVSFWEQGLDQGDPSDNAFVSLTFMSASQAVLGQVSTDVIDSHNLVWTRYIGSFAIPAGTASIDYTMHFIRNQGSDNDAFIDDNSLTVGAVPEPGGLGLMIAGLGGLGLVLRRRLSQHAPT